MGGRGCIPSPSDTAEANDDDEAAGGEEGMERNEMYNGRSGVVRQYRNGRFFNYPTLIKNRYLVLIECWFGLSTKYVIDAAQVTVNYLSSV